MAKHVLVALLCMGLEADACHRPQDEQREYRAAG
jgi:hypothetical protein